MQIIIADGRFYTRAPGASVLVETTLPAGVLLRDPRPCFSKNKRVTVINGRFNPGLVYRDDLNLLNKLGMTAPSTAPVLADGGAGALTGIMIGYLAAVQLVGPSATKVHESSLSEISNSLNITNREIDWTIPATHTDARTTHYRLYRSVDGALPRWVADVALGTTTYHDTTSTATLLNSFTPLVTVDGDLDPTGRDAPPYCLFTSVFHGRTVYFGNPEFPYRWWFSAVDEPESVGPNNYRDTTDLKEIVGGGPVPSVEQFLIFGISSAYVIAGYTQADFVIDRISSSIGLLSHFTIVIINERMWFWAQDGQYLYDGQFRYMMKKLRSWFRDDYASNCANFKRAIAADDRHWHTIKILIPSETGPVTYYVGHYLPVDPAVEGGESQPWWVFDKRDRPDNTIAAVEADGDCVDELWTGSCDGMVRRENQEDDADDDGDTYGKKATIRTKHYFLRGQHGGRYQGMKTTDVTLYLRSANQGYRLSAYAGDDTAREASQPSWGPYDFPPLFQPGATDETAKLIKPKLAGAATFELEVNAPVGLEYRGISLDHVPGPRGRGRK